MKSYKGIIKIRSYQPCDFQQIRDLDTQVQPYRPEDQVEVDEMSRRAQTVEQNHEKWAPIPTSGPSIEHIQQDFLVFWVAVLNNDGEAQIAGIVGVGYLNPAMMPLWNLYAKDLLKRRDFVELQHLRVSPNARGLGVGKLLCQAVIDWSRQNGYKMLLVNTTSPQLPAVNLYQKLGFVERERTFVGRYELIWMEKEL